MPITTLTETLDNLYTTTWQNMKSVTADQIFDATPFWFWMRANGMLESVEGGRFLTEPLRYAKSANIEFVVRGSSVDLSDQEFLTTAKEDWKYLVDTIVRFGVDDQQNRGKNAILSLVTAKLENSKDSLVDTLETRLAGAAGTNQFNGLLDIVPDDPTVTAATLHGIDPSTETWWQSKEFDATGSSFIANGVSEMNSLLNDCSNNLRQDTPDIILSGQTPFESYWEQTLEQRRVTNRVMGDAGFQNVEFRGIPMVWSPAIASGAAPAVTAGRMYFLNTRFLKFKYDPMLFFDMTEWKDIPNQINDRAAQVILAGNLMTGRRRVHGVMHTMNTP